MGEGDVGQGGEGMDGVHHQEADSPLDLLLLLALLLVVVGPHGGADDLPEVGFPRLVSVGTLTCAGVGST